MTEAQQAIKAFEQIVQRQDKLEHTLKIIAEAIKDFEAPHKISQPPTDYTDILDDIKRRLVRGEQISAPKVVKLYVVNEAQGQYVMTKVKKMPGIKVIRQGMTNYYYMEAEVTPPEHRIGNNTAGLTSLRYLKGEVEDRHRLSHTMRQQMAALV